MSTNETRGVRDVSAPEFEVLTHDVPVAWTAALAKEDSDDQADDEIAFPLVFLDFAERGSAAEVMMAWLAADGDELDLEAYYWVWIPVPGDTLGGEGTAEPVVQFTIARASQPASPVPQPALSFRINVQHRGAFMSLATEHESIGIAAMPPSDWPDDTEPPAPTVVVAQHDPNHLLWVELLAWRHALAHDEQVLFEPESS